MRDRIIALCTADPSLADDDKRLIATVWYKEGWTDPELLKHIRAVSSPESIRRTRAKLRESGLIKTTKETEDARYAEMGVVKDGLGY